MDLKNFDKQIKSTLENIEAPFDSASWQSLEHRLNKVFSEEQPSPVEPVDLVVKRSLERIEAPYRAADWSLLNNLLNQKALVRRIRLSKLAEAAIFLLLLINIEGFLGGFKEVLKPSAPAAPKSSLPMAKVQRHKKSGQANAAAAFNAGETGISGLAERVVALMVSPFEAASDVPGAVEGNDQNPTAQNGANASVLDASNFYNTTGIVAFHKIAPLPQSKIQDFAWKNFYEPIPGIIIPAPHKANGMYAASFATYDKNKFHSTGFDARESGYGGGIAVGYRKGKWGVESGIAYSHKNFTPQKDIEIYAGSPVNGFLGAYVTDVEADLFNIPVKITRRLARFGRTTAHATAGVSASIATEKRFVSKSVYYPPVSPDPSQNPPNTNQFPIPGNNDGLLEGGSLRSNAYASADVGLRVERSLGKRYVAFFEPSYHHALGGGFGPKKERINTFSFQAGVMAAL